MQGYVVDNRYDIVRELGSGGMARVYLAHDEVLDRDIALKVLKEKYADDGEFAERFRREAKSAASLTHPNIVQVYDRGEADGGISYIAMEHVPGGTLKQRVDREGTLAAPVAAGVAAQVAEALDAAHARGVIHRDIKPQNVLITAFGDVKVGDFGIARAAAASTVSEVGTIMGTAGYMSPEQAMGKPVTPASDLYSLGVVLYEMLTGELPFTADDPLAVSVKHVKEAPRPPRELNPSIPPEIDALVMRLLSKNPAERYEDAGALAGDLLRLQDGLAPMASAAATNPGTTRESLAPAAPSAQTAVLRPRTQARRWRMSRVLAVLALLVLLGGVGWILSQGFSFNDLLGGSEQPVTTDVPSLDGLGRDEAGRRLSNAGLEPTFRTEQSSESEAGEVIEQSPAAGQSVRRGSEVAVVIGDGPPPAPAEDPDPSPASTDASADASASASASASATADASASASAPADDAQLPAQRPQVQEPAGQVVPVVPEAPPASAPPDQQAPPASVAPQGEDGAEVEDD